jgi:hypothetical protein
MSNLAPPGGSLHLAPCNGVTIEKPGSRTGAAPFSWCGVSVPFAQGLRAQGKLLPADAKTSTQQ